jgi:Uma2 family endonuclease
MDAAKKLLTYAEYLEVEEVAVTKSEYLRGEIFAMAGGTPQHAALSNAIVVILAPFLRGKPCRSFSSDLRVRVSATDFASYPDSSIICGSFVPSPDDANAASNPTVIIEVLSDSTEAYDRGEKFSFYRQLASLHEYVLISQRTKRVEVFRKNLAGRWELYEFGTSETAEIASIDARFSVDELYFDPLAQ